ncbi:MAG: VCBS repeat-containing protein [Nannocystaceae bacterium]
MPILRTPRPRRHERARRWGRPFVGLLLAGAQGCTDLPTEALGTTTATSLAPTTTASSSGSGSSSGEPAPSTSTGPSSVTDDGSSTAAASTTDLDGSSSSDTSGEPLPACGDGVVVAGELCHVPGPPIEVDPAPLRLATVDLDQDGAVDLAVANPSSPELQILYGVGDGNFVAVQPLLTADANIDDLVAADFSGDGWPDLVVTDDAGSRVVSYANDGAGNPFFAGQYPTFLAVTRLVAGDVSGDGTPDLVATANGTGVLMLGNGLAGFLPPLQNLSMAGNGPHRLALRDLDLDLQLDLVSVNQGGGNSTGFLGSGVGLGEGMVYDTANTPEGLALGDIDDDGVLDLLVAHAAGDEVGILLGDGMGGFGTESLLMVADDPRSVALVDLDLDGHLDLLVAHTTPDEVIVHLGVGDGTFMPGPTFSMEAPAELVITELNGDGVDDVVVLRPTDGALQVIRSAP